MVKAIIFGGDLWLPKGSKATLPTFSAHGLVINLEAPITAGGTAAKNKICLATDRNSFVQAFDKLPLAVCLANNHIIDYGEAAYSETIKLLDDLGVQYFGAGGLLDRCNNPAIVDVDGIKVALLGYVSDSTHPIFAADKSPGVAPIDPKIIARDIEYSKSIGAERIVLCLHWGEEEVSVPRPEDVALAGELLELDVDLIVGHHAHCIQPVLFEKQKYVFFGLGNAYFPDFEYRFVDGGFAWSKQRWWNRTALFVSYRPRSRNVEWDTFREANGKFRLASRYLKKLKVWNGTPYRAQQYVQYYRTRRRIGHLRLAISRFIARPRIPTFTSIKSILRTINRG